jgi:hypothetical protein
METYKHVATDLLEAHACVITTALHCGHSRCAVTATARSCNHHNHAKLSLQKLLLLLLLLFSGREASMSQWHHILEDT